MTEEAAVSFLYFFIFDPVFLPAIQFFHKRVERGEEATCFQINKVSSGQQPRFKTFSGEGDLGTSDIYKEGIYMVTSTEHHPHSCRLATWTDRLGLSCMLFAHYIRSVKYASNIQLSVCVCVCVCVCVSTQSCPTLCDSVDYSPSSSSVQGISQAKTLEWVAIFHSRGSTQPRDGTQVSCVSCTAGIFFTAEPLGKPVTLSISIIKYMYKYEFYAFFSCDTSSSIETRTVSVPFT